MEQCRLCHGIKMMDLLKSHGALIARWALGIIFIYASIDKLAQPAEFARAIGFYKMVPLGLENSMAVFLPWMELFAGICLLTGVMVDGANLLVCAMLIVFIVAISQALGRGIDITCGCFKVTDTGRNLGFTTLLEDFVFLGLSLLIMNRTERKLEIYPKPV